MGGEGWVCARCTLHQSDISWRISYISLGDALFFYPQLRRTFLVFSHILSPLWHWKMWGTSSVIFPQLLGHSFVGHDSFVAINFTIWSSLVASLIAHLSCRKEEFLVSAFRTSQSTWGFNISWSVSILRHQPRRGVLKVVFYISSRILLETLSPSAVFLFPSEDVGAFVNSL